LDNVLLDINDNAKLCDFGVSKLIQPGETMYEQCGTPAYIAPEIILDRGYHGYNVDPWSIGVMLYALLTGSVPFKAETLTDLYKIIIQGIYKLPLYISAEAKHLIINLLRINPIFRLTLTEVLEHPWLTENQDDFNKLIKYSSTWAE